jgi:hypothetical protein
MAAKIILALANLAISIPTTPQNRAHPFLFAPHLLNSVFCDDETTLY